ncbi:MAG: ABC transporter substrate-binding protein, partial [Chloroflexi bacterium]|nr:ABC transporter substrate-binding protein [Chloroflexota bacterium]
DVQLVGGGPVGVSSISGGSSPLGQLSGATSFAAISKGADAIVIGQIAARGSWHQVVMRKDVADQKGITAKSPLQDRLRALKGLSVVIHSEGGVTDTFLRMGLALVGIDRDKDLEITAIPREEDALAGLKAKRYDAYSQVVPTTIIPVVDGYGIVIFDSLVGESPIAEALGQVVLAQKSYAQSRPEVVEAFMRGVARTERLRVENEAKFKDAVFANPNYSGLERKYLDASFEAVKELFPKDPLMTPQMVQDTLNYYNYGRKAEDQIKATFDQLATNRFAEAAMKQLGF